MHYVYFLYSKKLDVIYVGETSNIVQRFMYHNAGRQRYTKKGVPWQFVAYVPFNTKLKAKTEERRLKQCRNRMYYKKYILEHGEKMPLLRG